jgi:fimbrial chaperone protein
VRTRLLVWIAVGWVFVASPAVALRVVPIVLEFAPKGGGANQVVRLENETPEPIAVQISMHKRLVDLDGKETLEDADDDFIVFPPQVVLLPNENRAIRVQWIGDPAPASELAYRMVTEQLPVELSQAPQGARVRIVMRYEGAAYIVPPNAKPRIEVERAEAVTVVGGRRGLAITVRNGGSKHALLNELKVTVRSGERAVTLGPDNLQGMVGQNVLAGKSRRFVVPWPTELPVGGVNATLEYRAEP